MRKTGGVPRYSLESWKIGRLAGWFILVMAFFFLVGLLSGCLPGTPIPATPTEIPTATQTFTPTVVWFPPTATWTPFPTVVPSPATELRAGVGSVLLRDDFAAADHWLTGYGGQGSIALGLDELTLAVSQPQGYLFSFRDEPVFEDFYAEITASPNICTGIDEYGLLFRYSSPRDFYRFSLSCDGQARLDKVVGGLPTSPQPWLPSSSVPSGAPSASRLGVWVRGDEMRFFVNDEFQFALTDRVLHQGMIGVFARSAGETAVTVSFSDLVIHQISQ